MSGEAQALSYPREGGRRRSVPGDGMPGTQVPRGTGRGRGGQPVFDEWLPPAVEQLLVRARGELAAARSATEPAERFRRAHLAALRVGAAVLALRRISNVRSRPTAVWELVGRAAPELYAWAAYFASGAPIRAAVEAGRESVVTPEQADHVLTMAGMFLELVEELPRAARAS